jgi:hypothetical protein
MSDDLPRFYVTAYAVNGITAWADTVLRDRCSPQYHGADVALQAGFPSGLYQTCAMLNALHTSALNAQAQDGDKS